MRGVVLLNGAPVAGAQVAFMPPGGEGAPTVALGRTNAEGRFELMTGEFMGAVAGEHVVTVWKSAAGSAPATSTGPESMMEQYQERMVPRSREEAPPQPTMEEEGLLPPEFADQQTSPIRVTVTAGENDFTIELSEYMD